MEEMPLAHLNRAAIQTASQQMLWEVEAPPETIVAVPNLDDYDRIIVAFSGGADSTACVLHLLDCGVPASRIHLHHHLVDGDGDCFMDWPVTESYCRAFARAFNMEFSVSYRVGGFEREMNRVDASTAPVSIPFGSGRKLIGGSGPLGTRRKFPQQSSNLSVRWCSGALKIGVCDSWINNDPQFLRGKTLLITGERAEESKARSKYKTFEPHRADNRNGKYVKRYVDHWRPVHGFLKPQVWEIIRRYRVEPHVSYRLRFSRASCLGCVFLGRNEWAAVRVISPRQFNKISTYEQSFGVTIHRKKSVEQLANEGDPPDLDPFWLEVARSTEWTLPIFTDNWTMPIGAFGDSSCGPS
ncbi:phosphoadenosine phosphosulfate reductase [Acidovorax sp. sic0104]|uniref:phosphoadenosine phosphosulfate reductase n=1 Tax=Acidovorax sp. sic0104 TaxID=2854784 RepID=UPI001C463B01|nr:phosphoadenosine phosphosulfate reductase [Acidovorax sp. sic0104]MBV7542021.1 phosphoadenosine phosphosulfate reductase [Acidovorax sp. sic0104]